MIRKIADNITSPLGLTTADNYKAVCEGKSCLKRYEGKWELPEPFVASLFQDGQIEDMFISEINSDDAYTRFEKMVLLSATKAIEDSGIDASSDKTIFVLSTTKGNVSLLEKNVCGVDDNRVLLGVMANVISCHFGNSNMPIVVSNACISGVCAQIVAKRCLESSKYDNAVVIGADEQSPFIVSGFMSFRALSPEVCHPFSKNRNGLNLGEAAATIIYQRCDNVIDGWQAVKGAIRNDANHISGPSRTGEGSYRALKYVMTDEVVPADIAVVNVHGTATVYNDDMESIALSRAGLSDTPINGYKGYYGHTMGAAGILESILSMKALDNGLILPTRGFDEIGVTHPVNISNKYRHTDKKKFIKLLSGFGGCNVAMLFSKG
ncbi:MAG: beta-ketoacyl synthase [Prevotella sp.]|jgi:3-oxoacyl-[acyl-carrier-protein] synthase-1|nr:beta-ketoacyl synthase [Prevotella sp.]MBP7098020.1 beta-ketoacyl synthase [Prevotella sp.]MBP8687305.1 beta-ketoacyl synthase [Prevotella sp.]MBP8936700.1 beta-ketoacyl synthase [Prevotella sp.]MBP9982835.1 beta-ketoacyl synthase [Prevotella sp.]